MVNVYLQNLALGFVVDYTAARYNRSTILVKKGDLILHDTSIL